MRRSSIECEPICSQRRRDAQRGRGHSGSIIGSTSKPVSPSTEGARQSLSEGDLVAAGGVADRAICVTCRARRTRLHQGPYPVTTSQPASVPAEGSLTGRQIAQAPASFAVCADSRQCNGARTDRRISQRRRRMSHVPRPPLPASLSMEEAFPPHPDARHTEGGASNIDERVVK